MPQAIQIINRTELDCDINVFIDSVNARGISLNTERLSLAGNLRRNPDAIAAFGTTILQHRLDHKDLLIDLDPEDPAVISDPGLPNFFWGNVNGDPVLVAGGVPVYLVARETLVTITWVSSALAYTLTTESPPSVLR